MVRVSGKVCNKSTVNEERLSHVRGRRIVRYILQL